MVLSWVRRGLRTGIVTTRYPAAREQMPPQFRGRPVLDPDLCRAAEGCRACVEVCLPDALSLTERHRGNDADEKQDEGTQALLTLDLGRCIVCGLCVNACPAGALGMTEEYELATNTREALKVTAIFSPVSDPAQDHGKEGKHA